MSKSGVKQFCSILNYLRNEDELLYNIITDLCMSHLLKPKKDGVTLLRPVGAALKELHKLAQDDPEAAVKMLHSLIIQDYVTNEREFEGAQTIAGSLDAKSANFVKDKKFIARNSHYKADGKSEDINMAIWLVDKPVTVGAKGKREPKKKKIGGADLGETRESLFEAVLTASKGAKNYDPAMEVLVCLANYLEYKGEKECCLKFCSQFSNDTLTSLAILLRPYADNDKDRYIDDSAVRDFNGVYTNKNTTTILLGKEDPSKQYKYYQTEYKEKSPTITISVDEIAKPNAIVKLTKFYDSLGSLERGNAKAMFAEAELRVIMAVLHDNEIYEIDRLRDWYRKCKLDQPYLCSKSASSMDIGVYYSTILLIVQSDALVYRPGSGYDGELKDVVSMKGGIKHDGAFRLKDRGDINETEVSPFMSPKQ